MSKLVLHDKFETEWNSLGYGPLNDAILPRVTRGRNAEYTLEFQYPVKGVLFDQIKTGNWVVTNAGTKSYTENQRFEIQTVTKPINGIVSVYAEHYRYQLLRSAVKKSANVKGKADDIMKALLNISIPKYDFVIDPSQRLEEKEITLTDPAKFANTMEAFGGTAGSVLDLFGGEYIFDNNKIKLPEKAGVETGIVVAYGKNLLDISQEESIENTFTSIYPWAKYTPEAVDGKEQEEQIITVDGDYVDGEHVSKYRVRRIESVDFSNKKPTNKAELLAMAQSYVKSNNVGVPKVSIKTKFVDLTKSVQSGDISKLEEIDLCDYITVAFNELGINAVAQVTKVVWRPDLEQFETVELGDARTNLGDVISDNTMDEDEWNDKIKDITDDWKKKYFNLQGDIDHFGDVINNPGEGHVVVYPSLADPQEIYIMDTTNINTAKKMWRWNEAGLAYSKTGRNGPWVVGMNKEGQIVADLISTGTLRAIDIVGVTITGARFETTGSGTRTVITGGTITIIDSKDNSTFAQFRAGSLAFYDDQSRQMAGFSRSRDTTNGELGTMIAVERGYDFSISTWDGTGEKVFTNRFAIDGSTGKITINSVHFPSTGSGDMSIYRGVSMNNYAISGGYLKNMKVGGNDSFTAYNNAILDFYANLNMHGFSILNQSDIRLKENIEKSEIDAIKETKKLEFYEFDRKQMYSSRKAEAQPNADRELGLIAQYTPFLAQKEDNSHYLTLNVNKQIMLNSMTNKQLIERVEELEQKLEKPKLNKRKYHKNGI